MNRIPGQRRGAAALVVLALCSPPFAEGQASRIQPVQVVNPDTNPVPVKPMGTVPVTGSVAISGSVPVTGSVGITGLPNVVIANATEGNPLTVRMLSRHPYAYSNAGSPSGSPPGIGCRVEFPAVVSGWRLVVEQISGQALLTKSPVGIFYPVSARTLAGDTEAAKQLLEPKLLVGSITDVVLVSQQVRIYVPSNRRLAIDWPLSWNYGPGPCEAHLSGYVELE